MTDQDRIVQHARGFTDSPALLGDPVAIRSRSGDVTGWFIPLVDGDRIVGFVELLADLRHRRTSQFGLRGQSAPAAVSWLDTEVVLRLATGALRPGEQAGDPYLSFDQVPDRLAWAVPIADSDTVVYVAGDAAWRSEGGPIGFG